MALGMMQVGYIMASLHSLKGIWLLGLVLLTGPPVSSSLAKSP